MGRGKIWVIFFFLIVASVLYSVRPPETPVEITSALAIVPKLQCVF